MSEFKKANLVLDDGTVFTGKSFAFHRAVAGELITNTAMTGYPESLTDPSCKGQILVASYPLVGNYGVPPMERENGLLKYYESEKVHVSGLIISDYSFKYSHWNAGFSLGDWLKENKIPALFDIDTRELTRLLHSKGSTSGKIIFDDADVPFYDSEQENLASKVGISEKTIYGNGRYRILLIDLGVKNNVIRSLLKRDATVIRVPWDYDFSKENYDGLLISSGPGNPQLYQATINNISLALNDEKPIFGICLGNHLLGLAAGGTTRKLKNAHCAHNQPVKREGTNNCFITSQNHSYVLDAESLGQDWEQLFVNLNDGTNEGIRHKSKPFFSVQFHPEASSGPTDTEFLFDDFMQLVKTRNRK